MAAGPGPNYLGVLTAGTNSNSEPNNAPTPAPPPNTRPMDATSSGAPPGYTWLCTPEGPQMSSGSCGQPAKSCHIDPSKRQPR